MKLNEFKGRIETDFLSCFNDRSDGHRDYLHWHPHYEMLIVYSSGRYTLTNNSVTIAGDGPEVFIHAPYTLHVMQVESGRVYDRTKISFKRQSPFELFGNKFDFTALMSKSLICMKPYPEEMEMVRGYSKKAFESFGADRLTADLYIALIMRLFTRVCEEGRVEYHSGRMTYIQDALRLMSENMTDPMTVSELSGKFGVSQAKFYADFKENTGSTYKKYLTDLRQTRARELMETGSSIINASLETGYSSEAHFIKAFREYWGMTPGEFRSSLKN